jgi:hypothetical protein
MTSSISKTFLVAIAGLLIAGMPLAASAQNFDNGPASRSDPRGHYDKNGNYVKPGVERRDSPSGKVRRQQYAEGFFGAAPGGWQGYFHGGSWYHHRRKNAGVWLYYN